MRSLFYYLYNILIVLAVCVRIRTMKIIHTADIHLDSPLVGVKDAALRRHELLLALANMTEYANNNGVSAIIVAGDLFDDSFTTQQTVESVVDIVKSSSATWFVLRGNHGGSAPYDRLQQLCPDIRFFGDGWSYYNYGNVTICGRELGNNDVEEWRKLSLNPKCYNVVVLHGDVDDDSYGQIDKRILSSCGANYVALGHRHAFSEHKFGSVRGCYSGALESRGFDEAADTGFVEIDTDTDKLRFVRQSIRSVVTKNIDVTNVTSDMALQRVVTEAVGDVSPRNYLNVVFCGAVNEGLHIELVAKQALEGRFFALRIKDETSAKVDLQSLRQEISLRGEFVKLAMQVEDEKLRDEILKLGLLALNGEVDL